MPTRSFPISFIALALACGPATDDTNDVAETTTSTEASSSSADSSTGPLDDSTSTTGSDDESTGHDPTASADSSSSIGGDSSSGGAPESTSFEIDALDAVMEPEGCAAAGERPESQWSIELTLPEDDGEFTMTETFGSYVTPFDCTAMAGGFACAHETTVDYSMFSEMDALVHLASSYTVDAFDVDGFDGTYVAEFVCTGTDCDAALRQWSLAAFPCSLTVPFTGAPGR